MAEFSFNWNLCAGGRTPIIRAAKAYFKLYGKWPSAWSKESVLGMAGVTWLAIDLAGKRGGRGLTKGRTLSKILEHLK